MSETADEVRRIAIYAADEYRATTGDNAFNLTFDGTMELLSIAIRCERDRCAKIAEAQSVIHMSDAGYYRDAEGKWQLAKQLIRDIESYNASVAKSNAALSIASSIRQSHPITDKEQT